MDTVVHHLIRRQNKGVNKALIDANVLPLLFNPLDFESILHLSKDKWTHKYMVNHIDLFVDALLNNCESEQVCVRALVSLTNMSAQFLKSNVDASSFRKLVDAVHDQLPRQPILAMNLSVRLLSDKKKESMTLSVLERNLTSMIEKVQVDTSIFVAFAKHLLSFSSSEVQFKVGKILFLPFRSAMEASVHLSEDMQFVLVAVARHAIRERLNPIPMNLFRSYPLVLSTILHSYIMNSQNETLFFADEAWVSGQFVSALQPEFDKSTVPSQLVMLCLQILVLRQDALPDPMNGTLGDLIRKDPSTFRFQYDPKSVKHLTCIVKIGKLLHLPAFILAPYSACLDNLVDDIRKSERKKELGIDIDLPDAFQCPLTLEKMVDPVIASDGHSYERAALVRLISSNAVSPLTREKLNPNVLISNVNLKKRIRDYDDDVCDAVAQHKAKRTG